MATRYCSPGLLNHSIRSYAWGVTYVGAHRIAFDDERYYVSALLHDTGLTEPFDSHSLPFEEAGGHLAWVFGVAAGWPEARAARAEHIIVTHMRADVSAEDAESHLLQVATSRDVAGRRDLKNFPRPVGGACSTGIPGSTSPRSFLGWFEDQAERKPSSAAARSIESGGRLRICAHPLDV
ncbi:hypothetical protein [Micromonospora sp. AP08]|uniref:hypothetical protein n=1 Tax=Micromonospora sp. AP08 TaxID=2604467 RepID=UPI001CA32D52|nr:hypothetical protein [Micromonospora sp. AP08]